MSKIYTGIELFKMIAEGKVNNNTMVSVDNYNNCTLGFVFGDGRNLFKWLDEEFEIIEDNIDIQSIEELDIYEENVTKGNIIDKINDVVISVKQLDRQINNK